VTGLFCHRHLSDILSKPVGPRNAQNLTPASGVRTTRFCRPQQHLASSVCYRSQTFRSPALPIARKTLPSTASPPRPCDHDTPSCVVGIATVLDVIWGANRKIFSTGLDDQIHCIHSTNPFGRFRIQQSPPRGRRNHLPMLALQNRIPSDWDPAATGPRLFPALLVSTLQSPPGRRETGPPSAATFGRTNLNAARVASALAGN